MKMLGIVAMGVVRESRKFQGIHVSVAWGHCAVVFAIAQLSCYRTFSIDAFCNRDKYFRFWVQKVKVQGHGGIKYA